MKTVRGLGSGFYFAIIISVIAIGIIIAKSVCALNHRGLLVTGFESLLPWQENIQDGFLLQTEEVIIVFNYPFQIL
jgi:hypothetical protein